MHIRKPLAVTAALVTALSFTAAPAYAQGISVKKAGQQFKADVVAFVRSFSHVDSQLQTLQKNHRDSQAQVFPLYELLIGPTVRLGHELRTQQSPTGTSPTSCRSRPTRQPYGWTYYKSTMSTPLPGNRTSTSTSTVGKPRARLCKRT